MRGCPGNIFLNAAVGSANDFPWTVDKKHQSATNRNISPDPGVDQRVKYLATPHAVWA
jgi:hypothetical protein